MFRNERKKAIKICLDLQDILQKTYRNMDNSNERSMPIYRGEIIAYKSAIQRIMGEFEISRQELSVARRNRENEN